MKIVQLSALAALAIALNGCASVVKGTSESVAITTPPTTGANCKLSNSRGSWQVTTPGDVKVERSKYDMAVTCTKEGWNEATATIPSDFEGWTVGNLVLGGVIGVGVDAATGAMNEYPHAFQVPMTPKAGTTAQAQPAANSAPVTGAGS